MLRAETTVEPYCGKRATQTNKHRFIINHATESIRKSSMMMPGEPAGKQRVKQASQGKRERERDTEIKRAKTTTCEVKSKGQDALFHTCSRDIA